MSTSAERSDTQVSLPPNLFSPTENHSPSQSGSARPTIQPDAPIAAAMASTSSVNAHRVAPDSTVKTTSSPVTQMPAQQPATVAPQIGMTAPGMPDPALFA
eukprot:PhF_6_TR24728/c0_g1_i1/m.33918